MNTTEHAGDAAAPHVPSATQRHADIQRVSGLTGARMDFIILDGGLCKAFGDYKLEMEASAASSAPAVLSVHSAAADMAARASKAGPVR